MKPLWFSLAAVVAVPLVLFAAYFVHGSLEQFPTDEQHGKARLVAGVGVALFGILELVFLAMGVSSSRRMMDGEGAERPDASNGAERR